MTISNVRIQPVDEAVLQPTLRFLTEWVTASEAGAHEHLHDHASGGGSSVVALLGDRVVGIVTIRWQSRFAGFRDHGIPLVHQVSVAGPFRGQGIATRLMDAAEQLARDRGIACLGITVGLFDAYGPAQRMYAKRGYLPDGRGACLGPVPVREGATVTVDHDLIMWLTKDLQ
ncbi:GNAT family N-acetyltransferase [Actinopolymorpha alba]|uniref:GNAT family N-acetyltransferase n=1 Tax=Actinopolymorpha alba TaxID=533267 RepID=UPI0003609644|nr:GNAT family N-acetyltransferase [Actinopolymorpha alba]